VARCDAERAPAAAPTHCRRRRRRFPQGPWGTESAAGDLLSATSSAEAAAEHGLRKLRRAVPWTTIAPGSLLDRSAPAIMQEIWDGRNFHHQMMWERA